MVERTAMEESMTTNEAYSRLVDCFLALKAEGATLEQLAEALVLAASEANIRRYQIAEAYETLGL
jgi:hypothetical protein